MKYRNPKLNSITDVCCNLFLVCVYICVCECLLQNNIAGVPSSRATFGFPQYCASTVLVPAELGTLAVWIPNTPKKKLDG